MIAETTTTIVKAVVDRRSLRHLQRKDRTREIDLATLEAELEEFRLVGYERIPTTYTHRLVTLTASLTEAERELARVIAVILDQLMAQPDPERIAAAGRAYRAAFAAERRRRQGW